MSVRLKFAFLAFAMCVLGSATAFSQVRIVADGRLQTILERHIEYNEMSRSIQGYRIRVKQCQVEGFCSQRGAFGQVSQDEGVCYL